MGKATACLTTAPPGAGKTYVRFARFVFDDWLPNCSPGVHWSNFPVRMDPWEDEQGNQGEGLAALAAKRWRMDESEVRERVRQIPEEEVALWRDTKGEYGPWSYFKDVDINGAHIAFDEAHAFWPSTGAPKKAKRIAEWLSEIRHRGATVEFITQHPGQVAKELVRACGEKLILTNLENEVEPICGCRVGDWLELIAGLFTRRYVTYTRQERMIQWGMGWKLTGSQVYSLDPWYFGLYDSYSAPITTGGAGAMGLMPAWKRFSRKRLIWWFYSRNFLNLTWRGAAIAAYLWVALFGGHRILSDGMKSMLSGMTNKMVTAVSPENEKPSEITPIPKTPIRRGEPVKTTGQPSDLLGEFEELVKAKQFEERCENLAAKVKELEERLGEVGGMVMITGQDKIRFESGDMYTVGETIDYGPYKGKKIEKIDWIRRAVCLDDGRLVRLGFDHNERLPVAEARDKGGTGFQTFVSGNGGNQEDRITTENGQAVDVLRTGYTGRRSGSMADRRNGSVNSSSRGPRRPANSGRDSSTEFNGDTRRDGSEIRGSIGPERPTLLPRSEPPR